MYTFLNKIPKVTGLRTSENKLYYNMTGTLYKNDTIIASNVEGNSFWTFGEYGVYFHTEDGDGIVFRNDTNYQITESVYPDVRQGNFLMCAENLNRTDQKWHWNLGIIDLNSFTLVKSFPIHDFVPALINENIVIGSFSRKIISGFSIENGDARWSIDLHQFGNVEVKNFIGIWQNQLIVACGNHTLLSIDINTGEIITKWHELKGFEVGQFYKDVLPASDDFVLDVKAGKLIGVFHTFYFEIDLMSKEIKYEDLKEELSAHGISDFRPFNNNPFTDDHFYLTAHTHLPEVPDVDFSSIIALNRHTKKVDWFHVFKEGGLGTNVPQITPTHLYQLDTKNNLYVFERKGS